MLTLLISMLLSLLPARWRRGWGEAHAVDLERGALISGLLEAIGCLTAFCIRYIFFLDQRVGNMTMQVIAKNAETTLDNTSIQFGMGFITMLDYMIRPVSLVLIYFTIEGVVRFAASIVSGEVVGTMPLHVTAWARARYQRGAAERALGPRVEDEVRSGKTEGELVILSCRPKDGWNHLMTVSYNDGLYEIAGEQTGGPPRRFIYFLRPKPEYKVVRGLHHYDPYEPLRTQ